ncbi:hypothetical protein EJ08DRAFT_394284 [Tothia fuscella]|uniref:Uncharacterized protein n=1 Tax=Tothia fuscella TaxID=1048955 RepID=A0A9P4P1S5_9PEZI|nr:hypothetical protein EJ08DRAFT_394284 [Tothia fuscella]
MGLPAIFPWDLFSFLHYALSFLFSTFGRLFFLSIHHKIMQILHCTVVVAGLANSVLAKCYSTAEHKVAWSNKGDARNAINNVCRDFAGQYKLQQQKSTCVNSSSGQRYEFYTVMDQDPEKRGSYRLELDECIERFEPNVESCERGGQTTNKFMTFTLIPNPGRC